MRVYLKVIDRLNKLMEILVIILVTILAFVVLAQVVTRTAKISVAWLEEMARYSMIWVCFFGAAVACRRGTLIKVDVLYEILPKKICRILYYIVDVISIIFLIFGLYSCSKYLPLGFHSTASSMSINMFWFYLCMPLGMFMMILNLIANILERTAQKGGTEA
ncbi:MAG: TRAP transporter small permease [Lachnospiraceae bacterium]|nr:TRAP transporter small permease [Lachnospiraceae bacterium]